MTCRLTTISEAFNFLSDRDLNPVEFAKLMGVGETKTVGDLNKFLLQPELLKAYGVDIETISLREVIRESSESPWLATAHFIEDELKQNHIPVIFHSAKEGVAHTMSILAMGYEKDGTPYAILGEPHRGKYVKRGTWPHFEDSDFKVVGDYLKVNFSQENWEEGLSKYLGANTLVFSKVEG